MTPPAKLTKIGVNLQQAMTAIESFDAQQKKADGQPTLHITNMGHVISTAYEQLRNASENAEDHLLLQRAARRFFVRNISFTSKQLTPKLAEELTIELTQAEYLANNTTKLTTIESISHLTEELHSAYWNILQRPTAPAKDTLRQWTFDLMSVRAEQAYNPPVRPMNFAHFAHAYYANHIAVADYIVNDEKISPDLFQIVIYIAIHRALLKSDDANIRSLLLDLYQIKPGDTERFITFNKQCDTLFSLKTVDRVTRVVSRNGAHLRIMKIAFFDENPVSNTASISKRAHILSAIEQRIDETYKLTKAKLNSGIVKSIIFLLITKALIGLAVEIPYDLAVYSTILITPLLINLFFPAVFIAISTLTLKMPGAHNTKAIVDAIDEMLYDTDENQHLRYSFRNFSQSKQPVTFNIMYGIMFVVGVGLMVNRLMALDFNIVQGGIFILFLSTAAFLGYRLSLQIKELELVSGGQNIIALIRDFLYTPFIFIGHQISFRYAKVNIVARVLDTIIELPLKTSLRLIRQWTAFLNGKKEEML
ncbi:hypothetical protein I8H84_04395 [Candidatus Saccharibacteria bacterium]|nr:hypothetical protein [Candidatus Saccharibacteria bacterium]MBH1973424.1 hypothetical protein [Candidatus Saccharibacteria bacterium]MBH1990335.1 hypothetical protein [Candidatus Saccharibacteria bacterium]